VVVALMQENAKPTPNEPGKMMQIGFIIYSVGEYFNFFSIFVNHIFFVVQAVHPNERLTLKHLMHNYEVAKSGTYVNFREVCGRFELKPGYVD
jgi:hypothetical protein